MQDDNKIRELENSEKEKIIGRKSIRGLMNGMCLSNKAKLRPKILVNK